MYLKVNVTLLDTKQVPVKWNINATAAAGYGIESQDYTPAEVLIAGTAEELKGIDAIVLDDYEAFGLTESVETEVDLESVVQDMGVSLANREADRTVKLAINVEPYNRKSGAISFENIELIGKNSDYNYSIIGENVVEYSVYGLDSSLEILDFSKLKFSLDVTGLTEGSHTVPLQMQTTQEVELDGSPEVKIRISSK